MIPINELRFGSLVTLPEKVRKNVFETCHIDDPKALSESKAFKVTEISKDYINLHIGKEEIEFDNSEIESIPITKEWLKELGFNENFEGDRSDWMIGQFPDISPFSLQQDSDGIWFYCIGKYLSIEYVHQLQNLYFALTGEELKTETVNCKLTQS